MQGLIMVGKGAVALFWLVFGAALNKWLGSPFEQLVYLLAVALLLLHGLELWLCAALLQQRANPWLDRVQILLFGAFHLIALKPAPVLQPQVRSAQEEAVHA